MRVFLDTAHIEEIREAAKLGVISGVTTNPSLMMRAGRSDYREVTQEICHIDVAPFIQIKKLCCFTLNFG